MNISVIIRCLNEASHLPVLLRALRTQSLEPQEVIVVDSGSTDNTVQVASQNGARVLHIDQQEFSFGRALNQGAAIAMGDILVIVSAHVYPLDKNWLERLVCPFQNERVALVYGRQRGDHRSNFSELRLFHQWFPDNPCDDQHHPFCNNANAAIKKSIWATFPYDEHLPGLEDIHWAKQAMQRGFKVVYQPEATIIHVHEEDFPQIYRRYLREAIALRFVSPWEKMSIFDALGLMYKAIKSDFVAAMEEGVFLKEGSAILRFRIAQYVGAYRGIHWSHPEPSDLRLRLYYPKGYQHQKGSSRKVPLLHTKPVAASDSHKKANDLIDISLNISPESVVWPSSPKPKLDRRLSIENGDAVNDSNLFMNVHTGTHIDTPLHHFANGVGADEVTLESLVGEAWVLDFSELSDISLGALVKNWPPTHVSRILLKTRNSEWWAEGRENFETDYTALLPETAKWLVNQGIKLIGIDYLSVQRYYDPPTVHRVLLQAGVILLEGLNLYHVNTGKYELLCLPLKLIGSDGAPARAILRRL